MANESKPMSKTELINTIANQTDLSKRQVSEVFEVLEGVIAEQLSSKGPGVFLLPGLLKLSKFQKPAVSGGKTKPNPFKPGETMVTKDRPAYNIVRMRALKKLKSMV